MKVLKPSAFLHAALLTACLLRAWSLEMQACKDMQSRRIYGTYSIDGDGDVGQK